LENEVTEMNKELDNSRSTTHKGQADTPNLRKQELPRTNSRQLLPPNGSNRKLYSSVIAAHVETTHKVLITTKVNQTHEKINKLLKEKVNPTEIKVMITSLKMLRDGRVMIEAISKNEIEGLGNKIEETYGEKHEVNIQKRRIPRLVLLSISEDITLANAGEALEKLKPEWA
jgi:hypothetical protein